jgi:putative ABC transport system permease protein
MNLWHLIIKEISHRKLNFLLGLVSVSVAVGCLVGAMTLLKAHDIQTEGILATTDDELNQAIEKRQEEVVTAGKDLQNAMRKITKGLGFNILVLPMDQNLNELYTNGSLSKTMPEDNVNKLAQSKIVTVNHLLPMISKKIHWEDKNIDVILTGTRGEVPLMHRALKKPLQEQVPKGKMVLGYQIHQQLKLKQGDSVKLMGKEFSIHQLHPEHGTADDSTIWINLAEAQKLLKMENLIHAILALECNCATEDRVGEIRKELAKILPGTQIIERGPPALARAEARNKAKQVAEQELVRTKKSAEETIQKIKDQRQQLLEQKSGFASILVPIVILACTVWIGFLAWGNVRQRSQEIGILRAIGFQSAQVIKIFILKAMLIGLIGGIIGFSLGLFMGVSFGNPGLSSEIIQDVTNPSAFILVLILAPVLSVIASWIPAMLAAQQDPATILVEQ